MATYTWIIGFTVYMFLSEEDAYGTYARLMLKYYIAEAVVTKQSIFISSADENTEKLIKVSEIY